MKKQLITLTAIFAAFLTILSPVTSANANAGGGATQITAVGFHTCALTSTGDARCWGYNYYGQTDVPSDLGQVTQITAGYYHTCALTSTGDARCWGNNDEGQTDVPSDLRHYNLPDSPLNVTATSGEDGHSNVSWDYNWDKVFGSVNFTATASPGGLTCEVTYPETSCNVSGLDNGTEYTFSVVASNSEGSSDASESSAPATPKLYWYETKDYWIAGNPTVGGNLDVFPLWQSSWNPQPDSITFQWLRNGVAIDGETESSYQLGLTDVGSSISIQVTARHAGLEDYVITGNSIDVPYQAVPAVPTNVSATADDGQAEVSWNFDWDWAFRNVDFTVTSSPGGLTCQQTIWEGNHCTVYGLDNDTEYTFSVVAYNWLGQSDGSSASEPVTPKLRWHNPPYFWINYGDSLGQTLYLGSSCCRYTSPEPDVVRYQWLRDDEPIEGATDSVYSVGLADMGRNLTVRVTASHSGLEDYVFFTSPRYIDNSSTAIENSSCPAAQIDMSSWKGTSGEPTITGDNTYGQKITGSTGSWPSKTKLCYFWYSDGQAVPGVYTKSMKLTGTHIGKNIQFVTVGTSQSGASTIRFSDIIPVNNATFTKAVEPKISGVAKYGMSLQGSVKRWTKGVEYSYQWIRNGEYIEGANSSKYTLRSDDIDSNISLEVCGRQWGYDDLCLTSEVTNPVVARSFPRSTKVAIKGSSTKVGSYLNAAIFYSTDVRVTITWLRDGEAIPGEEYWEYVITEADRGHSIGLSVVFSQDGYVTTTKLAGVKKIP